MKVVIYKPGRFMKMILKTIFKICEEINGQYIVPILRERIKEIDQSIIKKATILELSQSKKLFKI